MLRIKKFYARSYDIDSITIFWELDDYVVEREDDIFAYNFFLSKSESISGPFDFVYGPLKNVFMFRDSVHPNNHKLRNIYYKLTIIDTRTNEELEIGPTAQIAEPDLMALEIIRQEDMLLRNFIGRRCMIFPAKTFGARCICIEPTLQRQQIGNCLTCYGIGYTGGYNTPILSYIQFDPNPKNIQLTPHVNWTTNVSNIRLSAFPPISPSDLIVEPEGERWIVCDVRVTQRLRYDIHQEATVRQLTLNDIAYKVPVNIDIKDIEYTDPRNFSNPQTINSVKDRPNYLGNIQPRGVV